MSPTDWGGDVGPAHETALVREVKIPARMVTLRGTMTLPRDAVGVVIFACDGNSSRRNPRTQAIARALNEAGLATLLLELLTRGEEALDRNAGSLQSDISLLAERLSHATEWLQDEELLKDLPVGYFGSGVEGGAALVAAATEPGRVMAVALQSGRADLAGSALHELRTPTLLIVGGEDERGLELNRSAIEQNSGGVRMEIICGASRRFEEPGALEEVASLASDWFLEHLSGESVGAIEVSLQPPPLRFRTEG